MVEVTQKHEFLDFGLKVLCVYTQWSGRSYTIWYGGGFQWWLRVGDDKLMRWKLVFD